MSSRIDPTRVAEATDRMTRFAERTGLTSPRPTRRYLWTDAFAVCNFLALARVTGDAAHGDRALRLVDRVHDELGRHREDDRRRGWISGLSEAEGRAHPTRGGLRIGKPLPERAPGEPRDADLEWEQDGQYFHYLTKWMHALDQAARATAERRYLAWARELAEVAHRAFTRDAHGRKTMAWKRSIDLSRALVPSMGQHDPLDGLVTCLQLDATADALGAPKEPSLAAAIADFAAMTGDVALATDDPLGLGGLLADAFRLAQIGGDGALVAALLDAAARGVRRFAAAGELDAPVERRLAFRELGLAIGLAAAAKLRDAAPSGDVRAALDAIAPWLSLRDAIERAWRAPASGRTALWREHEDIDDVMLATALVPDGFLVLAPPPRGRAAADTHAHA